MSTIHRKYREKEISSHALAAVIEKFEEDILLRYELLKFSSAVIDEAWKWIGDLGKKASLKTLDGIQFAFFTTYCERDDIFVCSDKKLGDIIQENGYTVRMT